MSRGRGSYMISHSIPFAINALIHKLVRVWTRSGSHGTVVNSLRWGGDQPGDLYSLSYIPPRLSKSSVKCTGAQRPKPSASKRSRYVTQSILVKSGVTECKAGIDLKLHFVLATFTALPCFPHFLIDFSKEHFLVHHVQEYILFSDF